MRNVAIALVSSLLITNVSAFIPHTHKRTAKYETKLFVFDFFKKRAEEGIDQLSNLADSASKGKIGEGLRDVASYTQVTNKVSTNSSPTSFTSCSHVYFINDVGIC